MKKNMESELIEDFISFESRNNLFENNIFNVNYWHLIRFSVYGKIQKSHFDIGVAHTNLINTTTIKKFILKLKQYKYFLSKNPLLNVAQKDVLILNHQRRLKEDGYYTCIYTDSLIENLNFSNIVLEEPILEKHLVPLKYKNILYTDYINFMVAIKKRLVKKRFSSEDKQRINELTNNLNSTFTTVFETEELEHLIYNSIANFLYRVKYYKRILQRIKPKVIIEVVSYGMSRYVVNHVAKELNIPTIELQHGTMGKYHIAYNFKQKMNLSTFPDYIFTFGQFWKDNTRLPIKDENIKVIGWPYFEKKVKHYKLYDRKNNDKKIILFISQGTIGKQLSKDAVELNKLIKDDYKIIYKLHPGEYARWKHEYPWLLDSSLEIIDHSNHDMHYYFAQSDIQVGVYSTSLFEGMGYNLKTFILPYFGFTHMEELINEDIVTLVSSSNELYAKVNEKNNSLNRDISYLWSNDSIVKMNTQINFIIEEHTNDS